MLRKKIVSSKFAISVGLISGATAAGAVLMAVVSSSPWWMIIATALGYFVPATCSLYISMAVATIAQPKRSVGSAIAMTAAGFLVGLLAMPFGITIVSMHVFARFASRHGGPALREGYQRFGGFLAPMLATVRSDLESRKVRRPRHMARA